MMDNFTQRRYWMMEYNQSWFETLWDNRYDVIFYELWSKEFRVRPEIFEIIINLVAMKMQKQNTTFRNSIQIGKRVAVEVFGIAKSTVVKIVNNFCAEICNISPQFIKFPKNAVETASQINTTF